MDIEEITRFEAIEKRLAALEAKGKQDFEAQVDAEIAKSLKVTVDPYSGNIRSRTAID